MTPITYEGRTVLITGASSGIGAEFARQFHQLGAKVVITARREVLLGGLKTVFNERRPGSCESFTLDLSSNREEDLKPLLDYIGKNRIDVLVNNAGRGSFGYFESIPLAEELQMVMLNVIGTLRLAHAVIPQMKDRRSGEIISVSSVAGFQALPYMATYAATKAFNLTHSLALREELAPFNVRVLAVCPGPVATEFGGVARVPGQFTGMHRDSSETVVRQSIKALARNRPFVVPGLKAKFISYLSRLLPRDFTTKAVGKILKSSLDYSVQHGAKKER